MPIGLLLLPRDSGVRTSFSTASNRSQDEKRSVSERDAGVTGLILVLRDSCAPFGGTAPDPEETQGNCFMLQIGSFPKAGAGNDTPRIPPVDRISGRNARAFENSAGSALPVMSAYGARVVLRDRGKFVLLLAEDGEAAVRVVAAAGSHWAGQETTAFLSSAGAIKSSASAMDTIKSVGATDAKCSASRSGER